MLLKAFTHANTGLCQNGSLVSRVWTVYNYSKVPSGSWLCGCGEDTGFQRLQNFKVFKKYLASLELYRNVAFTW